MVRVGRDQSARPAVAVSSHTVHFLSVPTGYQCASANLANTVTGWSSRRKGSSICLPLLTPLFTIHPPIELDLKFYINFNTKLETLIQNESRSTLQQCEISSAYCIKLFWERFFRLLYRI